MSESRRDILIDPLQVKQLRDEIFLTTEKIYMSGDNFKMSWELDFLSGIREHIRKDTFSYLSQKQIDTFIKIYDTVNKPVS